MKYGSRGAGVRRVQEQLIEVGYDLGPWGADGVLGDATWEALRQFAADEELSWNPEVPPNVLGAVESVEPEPPPPWEPPDDYLTDVPVVDVREHLREPQEKARVIAGRTVMRPAHTVTGITLHQTAVEYRITERMLRRADGEFERAHALRVQRAACHLMALQEGFVAWTRPLRSWVYHANALNRSTIGIEVEGNYAGIAGDPSTAWSGQAYSGPVTEQTIRAARKALLVAVTEGRRLGMPIEHLWAHRQSSGMRRNDPGEEIWRNVALEYGMEELGLKVHPEETFGSPSSGQGHPIPSAWDLQRGGSY